MALSTISQWQHGHRLPRSPRSLAVVDELERILGTPPGALRTAAIGTPQSHRSDLHVVDYAERLEALTADLGALPSAAFATLGNHDQVTIGPRGGLIRRRSLTVMRVMESTDRLVVTHVGEKNSDISQASIRPVRGTRLGRVLRDTETNLIAAQLLFDRTLDRGELIVHEVEFDLPGDTLARDYFHWVTHEVTLLTVEVTFDRTYRPSTTTSFFRPRSQAPDTCCHELRLDHGDRAVLVQQPASAGIHGIRWEWPG
ncbi:hypothetical protein [Dermatophilus congolensis]|uniref:hypothetical protein n=1 Tax=Dermatophilus congolensis TaxID=1863 RepID=UPI001AAF5D6C|nr:hypothetical protein [Dermatophilus congolensis]MBO3143542.1 hypothetical protein [Dermatophilus congolensis]MBO3152533.1 hypothetical protein [Dermatophilus congolensis]MBO3160456.1 hypothetical protein [Dermatophilus congolensis]MBO3163819.1 hypothetical protein [Dermatophilus congolensis]MBO3177365.1 hypothetical protein [Dermatophilus congolensis]